MATGLFKGGVDLDTLLMARVNTKRADVGIQVAGVDISNRFEAIGGGTPIANTGYRSGGVDIATLFRNISEPLGTAFTLTAQWEILADSFYGYIQALTIGNLTPTTFLGQTVYQIGDSHGYGFVFILAGTHAQNFFTSIAINGSTYLTSTATLNTSGGTTEWKWTTLAGLGVGNYPVTIS